MSRSRAGGAGAAGAPCSSPIIMPLNRALFSVLLTTQSQTCQQSCRMVTDQIKVMASLTGRAGTCQTGCQQPRACSISPRPALPAQLLKRLTFMNPGTSPSGVCSAARRVVPISHSLQHGAAQCRRCPGEALQPACHALALFGSRTPAVGRFLPTMPHPLCSLCSGTGKAGALTAPCPPTPCRCSVSGRRGG